MAVLHGIYKHFGDEVLLKSNTDYSYYPEHDAERYKLTSFWDHLGREDLLDHDIKHYISKINGLSSA